MQELLGCNSAGIMCAFAAAIPNRYLTAAPHPNDRFPSREVEFDCRGRSELALDGLFAYLDTGEVKSSAEVGAAIEQMGLRLQLLKWLLMAVCSRPLRDVRLVGRMFVPAAGSRPTIIFDKGQQAKATQDWGFSLYLHRV